MPGCFILSVMEKAIEQPRNDVSSFAPRIVTLHIKPDKIRDVIGPGGKVIRGLVEETGCKIDIEDDGTVLIASADSAAMEKAISGSRRSPPSPKSARIYDGIVRKIVEFGAFVEIMPGTDGLLHISQLSNERVRRVEDVLHEGDEIKVKVLDVDRERQDSALPARGPGRNSNSRRRNRRGPDGPKERSPERRARTQRTDAADGLCDHRHLGRKRVALRACTPSERRLALHRAPAVQGHQKAHRCADRRAIRRGRRRAQRLYRQGIHLLLRQGARRRPEDGDRAARRPFPRIDFRSGRNRSRAPGGVAGDFPGRGYARRFHPRPLQPEEYWEGPSARAADLRIGRDRQRDRSRAAGLVHGRSLSRGPRVYRGGRRRSITNAWSPIARGCSAASRATIAAS